MVKSPSSVVSQFGAVGRARLTQLAGCVALACSLSISANAARSVPGAHISSAKGKASSDAPTAADLYARSRIADLTFSYNGRQVINYWRSGRVVSLLVTHRKDGWKRIEYLSPESMKGRAIVDNRRTEWQFDPRLKLLTIRPVAKNEAIVEEAAAAYSLLKRNYSLTVLPSVRAIADRKAFVVSIRKKSNQALARRLWIDAATGVVLKRELYHDGVHPSATFAYSEINFHPGIGAKTFSLPGMANELGIRVVHGGTDSETPVYLSAVKSQLGGHAVTPGNVDGFALVGAGAVKYKGGLSALHLRYSDGLNLVSLFETKRTSTARPTRVPSAMRPRSIAGVFVHLTKHTSFTTINWDTDQLNLTLMGEVPEAMLSEFVQAIGH